MTIARRAVGLSMTVGLWLLPAAASAQRQVPPGASPYGAAAQPVPYGGSTQPSPYGATQPAPYGTTAGQPAPYGATAAQPSPYGGMQAGGLAPPPPMNGAQGEGNVEQELERAKEEDAGRGLSWVWLDVEGGFETVGLRTFDVSNETLTAGFVETAASGPVVGGGVGVRLLFLTIGARGRVGFFSPWQLFSIGGELGLHIPIGNLEPRITLGAGYTGLGNVNGAISGASDAISVHGLDARVGGGLDYYVTPAFSIGAGATWELLLLTRPAVDAAQITRIQASSEDSARAAALGADGSSYGSALALTATAGLHF